MQCALDAQPANGSGQMTVPIKSYGVSCLPSYRSREETRRTIVIQHANQERKINAISVNQTKKTPAHVAGSRGGRGRGGRGRSKELHILDHAAVGEDVVETPTRSPSSSPEVSHTCSRSESEESRVGLMLASQASTASKTRKDKKDNKLADDEEELMVAFLEANKMLWNKKATHYRRPDLKNAAWQKQADTMEKAVANLQGWFKGMRDNFARLDKLPKSGSGQRVFTERELWTMQKMHFLQRITYHKPEPVSSVSRTTAISSSLGTFHCLALVICNELPRVTVSSRLLHSMVPSPSQILTTLLCSSFTLPLVCPICTGLLLKLNVQCI